MKNIIESIFACYNTKKKRVEIMKYKDVIIVGTGKAGYLHFNSYKKFKNIGKIYFVDKRGRVKNQNIVGYKAYLTLNSVIKDNKLDVNNVIVDICTPRNASLDIIDECKKLGIKNIIVEKPFVVDEKFFAENEELNIVMINNYLYSKITQGIKKVIDERSLEPVIVYTNFSKNRIEEIFLDKKMYNKVTRNIEHDIPHQVYITQFLLGNSVNTKLLLEEENAMVKGDEKLEKNGYSKIISKKGDVYVIHESDSSTNTKIREVIVICKNDSIVRGEFLFYDKNLNKSTNGTIQVIDNNKIIDSKIIETDDNMYECLLKIYNYMNEGKKSDKYINEIRAFSKEMRMYFN